MVLVVKIMIEIYNVYYAYYVYYTYKKKSGNCRKNEAKAAERPSPSERKASTCN